MQYVADPSDGRRAYVLERAGKVRLISNDALAPTVVLDLTGTVVTQGECGLQGMAFAPDFATSRLFYLQYNTQEGGVLRTRVSRFTLSPDGTTANPVAQPVIRVDQPYENHKGGTIHFGGDGLLYLALGDGGSGNDPENRAQSGDSLLGKVLRIDPSGDGFPTDPDQNYRVPATNPSVAESGTRGEIWDFGFRNPFRWCVDDATKALIFADVGQDAYEEVDYEPAGTGGRNYGWRVREGLHPSGNAGPLRSGSLTDPFLEYDHAIGRSITGGFIARHAGLGFDGRYLFADYVDNRLWAVPIRLASGEAVRTSMAATTELKTAEAWNGIVSIDPDANGNVVVTELNAGRVSRLAAP